MPSIDSGDQMSPNYAPWAWIGKNFVGQTTKKLEKDGYTYRIGKTATERIVCEKKNNVTGKVSQVSKNKIPQEVLALIETKSFEGKIREIKYVVELIQPGSSIAQHGSVLARKIKTNKKTHQSQKSRRL